MDEHLRLTEAQQDLMHEDFLSRCAALAEAVPMTTMSGVIGELGDEVEMWSSDDPLERGEAYLAWRESLGFSVQETADGEIVEIPIEEL